MNQQTVIRRKKGEYGWSYVGAGGVIVRNLTREEAQIQAEGYRDQVAFDWQTARFCRVVGSYLQDFPSKPTGCIVIEAVLLEFDRDLMSTIDLYSGTALD